jgi:hypothetical protein
MGQTREERFVAINLTNVIHLIKHTNEYVFVLLRFCGIWYVIHGVDPSLTAKLGRPNKLARRLWRNLGSRWHGPCIAQAQRGPAQPRHIRECDGAIALKGIFSGIELTEAMASHGFKQSPDPIYQYLTKHV